MSCNCMTRTSQQECRGILEVNSKLIENIRKIAICLLPFMENTSKDILRQIGMPEDLRTWNSLYEYDKLHGIKVIEKGEPIFMRKNVEEELEYLRN